MHARKNWDDYFMEIASVVASRATCDRKHVGAVLVRARTILSTGYNGSIRGLPHCDEVGHMMENGHCVATIHAEANAIIQAAKNGVCVDGATIYTTASPCWPCFKLIANSGCVRVVFGEFYKDHRVFEYAQKLGIVLTWLGEAARPSPRSLATLSARRLASSLGNRRPPASRRARPNPTRGPGPQSDPEVHRRQRRPPPDDGSPR